MDKKITRVKEKAFDLLIFVIGWVVMLAGRTLVDINKMIAKKLAEIYERINDDSYGEESRSWILNFRINMVLDPDISSGFMLCMIVFFALCIIAYISVF